ncbi:unnamed protein product [Vitrella brassicaformis CCMP3155]|uniref:Uncharacterized protein n=1 Tax=Vitrella brassicaformis (strain CCMP3155) TaxID=1169540 RepID=A0A0G4H5D6_VITBC|nr:unnamed protein product [Vitrella brassicaformis CCMP3155]|eukprot:CEM39001.1 unnamed protein product [Vitrella brassicaformis CCMP3155]
MLKCCAYRRSERQEAWQAINSLMGGATSPMLLDRTAAADPQLIRNLFEPLPPGTATIAAPAATATPSAPPTASPVSQVQPA